MPISDCTVTGFEPVDSSLTISVTVNSGVTLSKGGIKVPALTATWSNFANPYITAVQFEYGPTDLSSGLILTQPQRKGAMSWSTTEAIVMGESYTIRYRAVGEGGSYGPWSTPHNVEAGAEWVTGGFEGQDWGATASEEDASNARVPLGVNAVTDSEMVRDYAAYGGGWNGPNSGAVVNRGVIKGQVNVAHAYLTVPTTDQYWIDLFTTTPAESLAGLRRHALPVVPGDRLFAGFLASFAGGAIEVQVLVVFYDGAGGYVAESLTDVGGSAGYNEAADPTLMEAVGGFAGVPAGARFAQLRARAYKPAGPSGDLHSYASKPMLCRVSATQTEWPPYQPGPADRASDTTGENTALYLNNASSWAQGGTSGLTPTIIGGRTQTLGSDGTLPAGSVHLPGVAFLSDRWPEEAGGNRTEARTSLYLNNASSWAQGTTNSLNPTLVGGRTQHLQTDGALQGSHVYRPDWGNMFDYWPAEYGGNVTENRTALLLNNASSWAQGATNGLSPTLVGGRTSRLYDTGLLGAPDIINEGVGLLNVWWPQDVNSNRTEDRTALLLNNASLWAQGSTSGLSPGVVQGRTQSLNESGDLAAGDVYMNGVAFLSDRWPEEAGGNRTETRTSRWLYEQAWAATQGAEALVSNAVSPVGTNMVIDSAMMRQRAAFAEGWNGPSGLPTTRVWTSGVVNYIHGYRTPATTSSEVFDLFQTVPVYTLEGIKRFGMAVMPGDRVFASVLAAYAGYATGIAVVVGFYDATGAQFGEANVGEGGRNFYADTGNPSEFARVGGFATVPEGTRYVAMWPRVLKANSLLGDAHSYAAQPMLCRVPANQTAWPIYSEGPADRRSDTTNENTALLLSNASAWAQGATEGLNPGGVAGRTSRLYDNGLLAAPDIINEGVGFLSTWWPQDQSSNRTEARTSLYLNNASNWAQGATENINPTLVAGRTQHLQTDGALTGDHVYRVGWGTTFDYWPEEYGGNRTEARTSLYLNNASSWAQGATEGLSPGVVGGRTQRLQTDGVLRADWVDNYGVGSLITYWPQDINSNRTEGRTSLYLNNASNWAQGTTEGMYPSLIAARTQELGLDGALPSTRVHQPGVAWLSDRWPEEAGGNRTETRQALLLSNASSWAQGTTNGLNPTLMGGRTQYLQTDGQLTGDHVYRAGWGTTFDYWPEEYGGNRTEARTALNIPNQAWAATNGSESLTSNNLQPVGVNTIIDSGMLRGGWAFTNGWNGPNNSAIARNFNQGQVNYVNAYRTSPINLGVSDVFDIFSTIPDQSAVGVRRFAMSVYPGDRIFASALLATNSGSIGVQVQVGWFSGAGVYIGEMQAGIGGKAYYPSLGNVDEFDRVGGFVTVPDNGARYAAMWLRVNVQAGNNQDGHSYAAQPMLCRVRAGQTAWPLYNEGPADRQSDTTGENTALYLNNASTWAQGSTSGLSPSTVSGRTQHLQSDGNMTGDHVYRAGWGNTFDFWPQEYGGNRTEDRTSYWLRNQAWAATEGSQVRTDNRTLIGPNANRVRLSEFSNGTQGWAIRYLSHAFSATIEAGSFANYRFLKVVAQFTAAGQAVSLGTPDDAGYLIPVGASERLAVTARIETFGRAASWLFAVGFYDEYGGYINHAGIQSGSGIAGYGTYVGGFVTAPSNARKAFIEFYGYSSGAGQGNIVLIQPMITTAQADQTILPPYSPGTMSVTGSDITAQNTALYLNNSSPWAQGTTEGLTPSTVAGRTQHLLSNGLIEAPHVVFQNVGYLHNMLAHVDGSGRIVGGGMLPLNSNSGNSVTINPPNPFSPGPTPSSQISVAASTVTFPGGGTLSLPSATISSLPADEVFAVFRDIIFNYYVAQASGGATLFTSPAQYLFMGLHKTEQSGGGYSSPPALPPGYINGGASGGGLEVLP